MVIENLRAVEESLRTECQELSLANSKMEKMLSDSSSSAHAKIDEVEELVQEMRIIEHDRAVLQEEAEQREKEIGLVLLEKMQMTRLHTCFVEQLTHIFAETYPEEDIDITWLKDLQDISMVEARFCEWAQDICLFIRRSHQVITNLTQQSDGLKQQIEHFHQVNENIKVVIQECLEQTAITVPTQNRVPPQPDFDGTGYEALLNQVSMLAQLYEAQSVEIRQLYDLYQDTLAQLQGIKSHAASELSSSQVSLAKLQTDLSRELAASLSLRGKVTELESDRENLSSAQKIMYKSLLDIAGTISNAKLPSADVKDSHQSGCDLTHANPPKDLEQLQSWVQTLVSASLLTQQECTSATEKSAKLEKLYTDLHASYVELQEKYKRIQESHEQTTEQAETLTKQLQTLQGEQEVAKAKLRDNAGELTRLRKMHDETKRHSDELRRIVRSCSQLLQSDAAGTSEGLGDATKEHSRQLIDKLSICEPPSPISKDHLNSSVEQQLQAAVVGIRGMRDVIHHLKLSKDEVKLDCLKYKSQAEASHQQYMIASEEISKNAQTIAQKDLLIQQMTEDLHRLKTDHR
eukprot:TRINITY_DN330_c0_g1_i1.p1 TRINITY_DN330_c0_g1~~TRINITY_DN330_c0_g1_i1.p1  ORF type:complete len:576 (+),score=152.01 TRINITY_DN330_c0_g1_i1:1906-3633(+)